MSHSKRKSILKRTLCLILAVVLFAYTFGTVAYAKTTTQMRSEISDLESKSKALEGEITKLKKQQAEQAAVRDALQRQIDNTQAEISACTSLISGYKSEIAQCEKEISEKEKDIEDAKFLFKQRMRSIYMSGSTNNDLLVLLDAENFSDYLALSEVSRTISAHDKKLVNSIVDAIKVINENKAKINTKLDAQKEIKTTLANKQAKLKAQQAEINSVIAGINSDKSSLEKKNKSYENAIASLEREIQAQLAAAAAGAGGTITAKNPKFVSGRFTWPVPGYYNITSGYGYRWGRLHGGIDISSAGIKGKPIVAAADGVVLSAGYNNGGYGYWVMINHGMSGGNQFATVYGHMISSPVVGSGQSVKAGQVIGYVGSTGDSTGNHCHFEIRVNGNRVNPMGYFSSAR